MLFQNAFHVGGMRWRATVATVNPRCQETAVLAVVSDTFRSFHTKVSIRLDRHPSQTKTAVSWPT